MMKSRHISAAALLAIAITGVVIACRPDTKVESGITGVQLTMSFNPSALDQIRVRGWLGTSAEPAFSAGLIPEEPRLLTNDRESVAILISDSRGGAVLLIRADGLLNGDLVFTDQKYVRSEEKRIVPLSLILAGPPQCYDGIENDLDGLIDYGQDPGCTTEFDNDEDDAVAPPTPVPTPTATPTPTPTPTPSPSSSTPTPSPTPS